jgi:peptidyl-prolyl cis-trans isomerase B (cyclophilin B)
MSQKKFREQRREQKVFIEEQKSKELRKKIIYASASAACVLILIIVVAVVNLGKGGSASDSASVTGTNSGNVPPKTLAAGANWDLSLDLTQGEINGVLYGQAAPQAVSSWVQLAKDDWYPKNKTVCNSLIQDASVSLLMCGASTDTAITGPGYAYGPIEQAPTSTQEYPEGSGTVYAGYPAGVIVQVRSQNLPYTFGSQFFITYGVTWLPNDTAGGYSIVGSIDDKSLALITKIGEAGIKGDPSHTMQQGEPKEKISIKKLTVKQAAAAPTGSTTGSGTGAAATSSSAPATTGSSSTSKSK